MLFVTAGRNTKMRKHTNSTTQNAAFCKASTHQGDPNVFHPQSVGRQCLPNSLMACVMAAIKLPFNWTTGIMDYILQQGDKLYCNIDAGHELLLPSDLPKCVHMDNRVCEIVRGKEAYGSFVENIAKTKDILFVLCTFIERTMTSALLCMGDQMGSSAIAVLSMETSFFIFDAHSRVNSGMPCPNGASVLMHFSDIDQTVSYICDLAHSLSAKLFHWTFWHALLDRECDCIATSVIQRPVDILSEDDIMKLYAEFVPQTPKQTNRTEYFTSYRKRVQQAKKLKCETVEDAMSNFKDECHKQPVYICSSCHKLLWEKGVNVFKIHKYDKISAEVTNAVLAEKHWIVSTDGSTYICLNCDRILKSGRIPPQSKANFMDLEKIPDELKDLNNLELHTICKRIIFMKLVKLPRAKQKGIKGAAVNVPADLGPACQLLPKIPSDAYIISLKLKRKLEYKQAYLHDTIHPEKVLTALQYLKNHNPEYSDTNINENWIKTWQELDEDVYDGIFDIEEDGETDFMNTADQDQRSRKSNENDCADVDHSDTEETQYNPNNTEDEEDMIAMEENCKLRDLPYNTCLQSQLPEEANQIFSIAPGEGTKPIPLLTDKLFEELSNPD